jgi:hypothetical protein
VQAPVARKAKIVLITGVPGSGKTWICEQFAGSSATIGCIDADDIMRAAYALIRGKFKSPTDRKFQMAWDEEKIRLRDLALSQFEGRGGLIFVLAGLTVQHYDDPDAAFLVKIQEADFEPTLKRLVQREFSKEFGHTEEIKKLIEDTPADWIPTEMEQRFNLTGLPPNLRAYREDYIRMLREAKAKGYSVKTQTEIVTAIQQMAAAAATANEEPRPSRKRPRDSDSVEDPDQEQLPRSREAKLLIRTDRSTRFVTNSIGIRPTVESDWPVLMQMNERFGPNIPEPSHLGLDTVVKQWKENATNGVNIEAERDLDATHFRARVMSIFIQKTTKKPGGTPAGPDVPNPSIRSRVHYRTAALLADPGKVVGYMRYLMDSDAKIVFVEWFNASEFGREFLMKMENEWYDGFGIETVELWCPIDYGEVPDDPLTSTKNAMIRLNFYLHMNFKCIGIEWPASFRAPVVENASLVSGETTVVSFTLAGKRLFLHMEKWLVPWFSPSGGSSSVAPPPTEGKELSALNAPSVADKLFALLDVFVPNRIPVPDHPHYKPRVRGPPMYHGSTVKLDIEDRLIPFRSALLDGELAVYATPQYMLALAFAVSTPDRELSIGFVSDSQGNQVLYLRELAPGVFEKYYAEKSAYVYTVDSDFFHSDSRLSMHGHEFISFEPVPIMAIKLVPDLLHALKISLAQMIRYSPVEGLHVLMNLPDNI